MSVQARKRTGRSHRTLTRDDSELATQVSQTNLRYVQAVDNDSPFGGFNKAEERSKKLGSVSITQHTSAMISQSEGRFATASTTENANLWEREVR